jgi:iron complex outermembrane receptor protein
MPKSLSARGRLLASTVFCSALLPLAIAAPVHAQTQQDDTAVEEIVVTGSRIARKDYVAASPIVTVGKAELDRTGAVTVEKLLNQLPQFAPGISDSSNNPSNNGQANIQLRGLGNARTLVLVDGHRVTPSNPSGVIDVNTIPVALIENVETITGGASTVYGSDALAGVVNFRLKKNFTGVQIDAQYGVTDRDDGETTSISLTAGAPFAEDKGHAVISFTNATRGAIFNSARSFSSYGGASATIPQGTFAVAGSPSQAAVDAVFTKYGLAAGAVKNTSAVFGFNNDGSLFFQGNNYKGPTTPDFSTIVKGQGSVATGNYNTAILNELQLPQTRYNVFSRVDYNVTEHLSVFGQVNFTNYTSDTELAPPPPWATPASWCRSPTRSSRPICAPSWRRGPPVVVRPRRLRPPSRRRTCPSCSTSASPTSVSATSMTSTMSTTSRSAPTAIRRSRTGPTTSSRLTA